MTSKEQTINDLTNADLGFDTWMEDIFCEITDRFAAGYLAAQTGKEIGYGSNMLPCQLRDRLLEICEWDIWGH